MLESLKSLAPICLNVNAPDFIPPTLKSLSSTFENIRPDIKGTFICMQILQRNWGAPKEYNKSLTCPRNMVLQVFKYPIIFAVEVGGNKRRVQMVTPPSPSGDGYACNRLSSDYAYTVPVGNGNYINIQGNDPELTKVRE